MQLRFGMAQWQHPAWVAWLYSHQGASNRRLSEYAKFFDTVEVGSSFYADLTQDQLQVWFDQVPDNFRFAFKLPQSITHRLGVSDEGQVVNSLTNFCELLRPFSTKLGPCMMQFPEEVSPLYFSKIEALCRAWNLPTSLSVEVRNQAFFNKSEEETGFLRLLSGNQHDRVIMDSRPVFSTEAYCESLLDAQKKKPRVPCHPVATGQNPMVRFIGHPDLPLNDAYLDQWAKKLVQWLQEGREPYVFVHSSDNVAAPLLAETLEQKIAALLPAYAPRLSLPSKPEQSLLL
ncbi:hypothetical protein OA92_09205 [Marinomonas sp. SBI22]|uniref:DUF72 domain-containing protein n=1 Tax=unclassified Marinomonas TaxID=196814 RepID=UPI0007AF5847|nr:MULTISPECIES: DUF72 domain-containing protein [unclassified Marinomonas]KZM42968.1 hypothetical protein OA92_09205 [Marinomonas sp. SBI22]KZM44538.1 hypothetical protein OA91_08630 [Marinomonas sp. SBI8L]